VKIFYGGEAGDVEQMARTSKQIPRICDCSFLSQLTSIYILHALNCLYLCMLDIYLCLIDRYAWNYLISCMLSYCSYIYMLDIVYICAHTSIQLREL